MTEEGAKILHVRSASGLAKDSRGPVMMDFKTVQMHCGVFPLVSNETKAGNISISKEQSYASHAEQHEALQMCVLPF